jgi:glycosyltransferase involved in cell wall biosynthesis
MQKSYFLVWPKEYKLSEHLGEKLGIKLKLIQAKNSNSFFLIRYLSQTWRTLTWLFKEKPRFVYIQNPPLLPGLIAYFYSFFNEHFQYALDHHSVFFRSKKWKSFHFLAKPIAKKALINSAHNKYDLEILKNWQVKATEMQFINPQYAKKNLNQPLKNKNWQAAIKKSKASIFMVNRFAENDDDYLTVIETAKNNPDWLFFITGNPQKAKDLSFEKLPLNLILTGYLKHPEFLKLMQACDIVLCLTLRENTVLWSIREALALNKVFITSETLALKDYFSQIAIFTQNKSPKDLEAKIKIAFKNPKKYQEKFKKFLKKDQKRIERQVSKIKTQINP